MKTLILAAIASLAWMSGAALAQGDAEAGAAKAAVCAGCHGADGKGLQPTYPNIGGQHASYIAKQLTNYREKDRVNQLMYPIAMGLSDDDILNLAAYYSEKPNIEGVAEEKDLELGENIYRGGITSAGVPSCTGCHGPAGKGNLAAVYPVLGGQNKEYTVAQLKYFRSGERNNDPNRMMRGLAHRLTDKEIGAVANYIAGLH